MIGDCVGLCRSEDAKRKHHRLQESHRIHAKVADDSDVTIIESEIEIEFFLENRIELKSIFCLVFVNDFDLRLYWRRQRTAASSKNDS